MVVFKEQSELFYAIIEITHTINKTNVCLLCIMDSIQTRRSWISSNFWSPVV